MVSLLDQYETETQQITESADASDLNNPVIKKAHFVFLFIMKH